MEQVDEYLCKISSNFFDNELLFEKLPRVEASDLEKKLINVIEQMQLQSNIQDNKQCGNISQLYTDTKQQLTQQITAIQAKMELYECRIQQLELENQKLKKVLMEIFKE